MDVDGVSTITASVYIVNRAASVQTLNMYLITDGGLETAANSIAGTNQLLSAGTSVPVSFQGFHAISINTATLSAGRHALMFTSSASNLEIYAVLPA